MNKKELVLSNLNHTWFIDLDGTIFKHNGYKSDGYDTILPGVKEFFDSIPADDFIVLVTSRNSAYKEMTLKGLKENNIKYNEIIFDCPFGERIIINDNKPSDLEMSKSVCLTRNEGLGNILIKLDNDL